MPKKLLRKRTLPSLSDQQKDFFLGLAIVLLIAIFYYAQWGYYLTGVEDSKISIDQPQRYFWWADDSREYRATGDWMFGNSTETFIEIRPWLYPFLTGTFRTLFGESGERMLWLSQVLMWLASTGLLYGAIHNTTKRTVLSIVGATLFFSHPSPLILTFHGLTETLNILLLSILCWLLTSQRERKLLYAILIFSLLTVTKPTYQVQLVLLAIYYLWINRKPFFLKQAGVVALALIPVWIQFVISFSYDGTLNISSIGPYTFKNFFVATIHAEIEQIPWRESLEVIEDWEVKEQFDYIFSNRRAALLTYRNQLIDNNLWIGSFHIRGVNNRMSDFVKTLNAAALYAHLFMLPLTIYLLISPKYNIDKLPLILIFLTFLIQTLVTGISTGQEDRLIVTGAPLWVFVYITTLYHFFTARPEQATS